jgi:hypothetical protein
MGLTAGVGARSEQWRDKADVTNRTVDAINGRLDLGFITEQESQ